MALSQVGLERLNTATTDKIGQSKNLIVNGSCYVAQRGVSATGSGANGYATVDRFRADQSGTDAFIEQHQVDVASGTLPYAAGLRKAFQIKNGNQTSGAGTSDRVLIMYRIEAQDIANSGWDYTSSSSYLTFSFYVKSSVAQNFFGDFRTYDGTGQGYAIETGSLTADTWTKVTKTIPGNSNLQFDNDNAVGLEIQWTLFRGTDTTGTKSLNTWAAFNSSDRVPDMASTWYTTDDATFEITGVQLELGSVATDFEHRSVSDELLRCYRYFQILSSNTSGGLNAHSRYPIFGNSTNGAIWYAYHKATMRVKPSLVQSGISASTMDVFNYSTGSTATFNAMGIAEGDENHSQLLCTTTNNFAIAQIGSWRWSTNADCYFAVNSEL